MKDSRFATDKNRWWALVILSLGLAIVIIDNTVLNVALPYILRDLHTTLDALQWVISGYALIIATVLITIGRLGDMYGRKKIFLLGAVLFAVGSFIASISQNAGVLFLGEALIEAIGAAMMLTSTLALLVDEFHGKERAIAFGIWGSVAGVAASLGPLIGGYLTTYYSWRWSLRINVVVALILLLGSVFVKESASEESKGFDWTGTVASALGLFSLVFGFIEGAKYGWWTPNQPLSLFGVTWPFSDISVIPFMFLLALMFLMIFVVAEYVAEQRGENPLVRLSLFKNAAFAIGLLTLGIVSLGQFGMFFLLPIYLQNAIGINAFQTGLVFLSASLAVLVSGPASGFVASRLAPKIVVAVGMFVMVAGMLLLIAATTLTATGWTLAPALIVFGIGIGMTSSQLTNVILSAAPAEFAGEASALNNTVRQVGTSIGVAVLGAVLASGLMTSASAPAFVMATRNSLWVALVFIFAGALAALFIPIMPAMAMEREVVEVNSGGGTSYDIDAPVGILGSEAEKKSAAQSAPRVVLHDTLRAAPPLPPSPQPASIKEANVMEVLVVPEIKKATMPSAPKRATKVPAPAQPATPIPTASSTIPMPPRAPSVPMPTAVVKSEPVAPQSSVNYNAPKSNS